MMHKVVKYFEDLTDNRYPYKEGDIFPRKGLNVSDERIDELSSTNNKRGEVLIAEIKKPKRTNKK